MLRIPCFPYTTHGIHMIVCLHSLRSQLFVIIEQFETWSVCNLSRFHFRRLLMGTSVCVQTTILHEMQCIHFQKWHLSKMPTRIWYSWDLLIFSAASRENQCRIIGNYKSAWYNIFIKCILYTLGFIYSTFAVDKWYENLANAYYLWAWCWYEHNVCAPENKSQISSYA